MYALLNVLKITKRDTVTLEKKRGEIVRFYIRKNTVQNTKHDRFDLIVRKRSRTRHNLNNWFAPRIIRRNKKKRNFQVVFFLNVALPTANSILIKKKTLKRPKTILRVEKKGTREFQRKNVVYLRREFVLISVDWFSQFVYVIKIEYIAFKNFTDHKKKLPQGA